MLKLFFSIVALGFLTSCGYRLLQADSHYTFEVKSIEGDFDGLFRQALIEEISKSPILTYQSFSPSFQIKISFSNFSASRTDYQYQTEAETGDIINRLSPVQGKYDLIAKLELIHTPTQKIILGPAEIRQITLYDFSDFRSYNDLSFDLNNGKNTTTLQYSLGQLAAEDDAANNAKYVLYREIAKKINSYLTAYVPSALSSESITDSVSITSVK